MQLNNNVWVITGGARGLGAGMAAHLASMGAHVALIDLDASVLDATATMIAKQHSVKAQGYVCDISDEGQVEHTFAKIRADFGGIHGLVNNAGLLRDGMLIKVKDGVLTDKMSLSQWRSVIDVNLTGSFLCGREAAAVMAEQGDGGVIVNVSSVSRAGNMGQSNYVASKAAVASLVVTWAKELARYKIRVGGIAPGVVATDMTAQMKPEAIERMLAAVPVRRLGEIGEIAHSLQFIVENDYFTGRMIEIDGGLRI
ncbi:SDR family oxidoreductase [Marinomonas primoryensis]|jgi:3-oxoacyl-[acyl-carrier protein] reductase|uniref:SDR family oxidoreductase n=1 Tax=Marinomonas primoryensis TaxID=178399 RepID=UPI00370399A4